MTISKNDIDRCIDFHGHSCPGLAIGMRAAEYCLNEFGHNDDMDMVAICESDMCGVDAIQLLTGCTVGKGNLIHRDYGKTAFTFYSRKTGKGKRITFAMEPGKRFTKLREAMEGAVEGSDRMAELRETLQREIMSADLDSVFGSMEPLTPMPRDAAILQTLRCEACGETMMESRARMFGGKTLCIPCFNGVEQKR